MQKEMKNYMITSNGSVYKETEHPTEKPEELIRYLLSIHTNEGDTVLDCFMGSGTTGVSCVNLKRNFIGIDKNVDYYNMATERIRKAKTQTQLSAESCPTESLIAINQNQKTIG